jgi:hypothetical protein
MQGITHRRALLARLLRATGAGIPPAGWILAGSLGACLAGTTGTGCASKGSVGGGSSSSTVSTGGAGGAPADGGSCTSLVVCFPPQPVMPECSPAANLVGQVSIYTRCPGAPAMCPLIQKVFSGPNAPGDAGSPENSSCCYFVEATPTPC